jgi:hypothetical protein
MEKRKKKMKRWKKTAGVTRKVSGAEEERQDLSAG